MNKVFLTTVGAAFFLVLVFIIVPKSFKSELVHPIKYEQIYKMTGLITNIEKHPPSGFSLSKYSIDFDNELKYYGNIPPFWDGVFVRHQKCSIYFIKNRDGMPEIIYAIQHLSTGNVEHKYYLPGTGRTATRYLIDDRQVKELSPPM